MRRRCLGAHQDEEPVQPSGLCEVALTAVVNTAAAPEPVEGKTTSDAILEDVVTKCGFESTQRCQWCL